MGPQAFGAGSCRRPPAAAWAFRLMRKSVETRMAFATFPERTLEGMRVAGRAGRIAMSGSALQPSQEPRLPKTHPAAESYEEG